ncbi:MAG: type II toxin-antitoxin system HicB family antitoxin [Spirochaetia bacterium]|nr:type II toxin-antitoxin system HicB family antitoxin [Spirochaetia bacterium]
MNVIYPAIFHIEDGVYWCEFPDLPGCQTYNDTLEKTINSAAEALSGYVLALLEDGKKLPPYSKPEDIKVEPGSFVNYIALPIPCDCRSIKKTLTIPVWLDIKAKKLNLNFSQVLQEALLKKVEMNL